MGRYFGSLMLICFFYSGSIFAQSDILRLYYNINEKVAARHRHKIDSVCAAHAGSIRSVSVVGYADYLGTSQYNIALSIARADNAKAYLQTLLHGISISSTGKGELPITGPPYAKGVPNDRRTDIVFEIAPRSIASIPKPDSIVLPRARVTFRDTIFEAKIDQLATLQKGDKLDIDELLFQPGRHFLLPASYKYADVLVELLKKYPKLKIKLIGHICCEYTQKDGFDHDTKKFGLSKYRAEFLYNYLVKAGIDENRMSYLGVGTTDPKIYPELPRETLN